MNEKQASLLASAHDLINESILDMCEAKPDDRSEQARHIAILITELEKIEALFERWFHQ